VSPIVEKTPYYTPVDTSNPHTAPILQGLTEVGNNQLKAILYLLQTNLEKLKDEVDRSYDLYAVGELTKLTKDIQRMMNDPLKTVIQASYDVDNQVKQLLDRIAVSYFKHRKGVIGSVYKTTNAHNNLHYSIILKEDTMENRMALMTFFDWYYCLGIEDRYPILFQFIPEGLISKINTKEKIL
jgi:hypothetical protein